MDSNKGVFYPEDIAKETGLGLNLVYRLLRAGEISHVKAGDRYLVSRANFEKWLSGESRPVNQVSLRIAPGPGAAQVL